MTYPAALRARDSSRKPAVLHVHSTEFDRTLDGNINPEIAQVEELGLLKADKIIAVSEYTKNMVVDKYRIPRSKVEVVHNGIDLDDVDDYGITTEELAGFALGRKIVIFVGRLTSQKGPDYFVQIASKIAREVPEALFVVAGDGDMMHQVMMLGAKHNLTGKIMFAGFIRDKQRSFLYHRADLFIMPSVSEPFGLVALEAASANTPVIISKQSGVSEVLTHAVTADYWDIPRIASQAISILQDDPYRLSLATLSAQEIRSINWNIAAEKCLNVYQSMCC
jgi:glycosyltransferase involved in cell wall biosynthesis